MARKLIVEIVGDASSLERSFKRSARATRGFGKDMERAGRGAVVASVGFRGLGRSVAFASAAFLGGAGITAALRSTVAAAEEAQRVQGQLTNVLGQMGLATKQNVAAIDARTQALSEMSGFDDELATQTFVNLLRVTGNVTKALRDNAIAADVARGRNIGLDAAAKLVTKAELGQVGALRRVGIAAKDGASSIELLDLLQRKFAGSAEAYGKTAAGAQDRFRVAVENTQEIIGAALLPSITRLLNRASDWLNNTENQKRIQDAANESVRRGTDFVEFLGDAYDKLRAPFKFVTDHDPFRGKSAVELIHNQLRVIDNLLGIESATEKIRKANERLIASLGGIRKGYDAIEEARRGATEAIGRGTVAQPLARGAFTVGRGLTPREQLDLALAANPDDVSALRSKRALLQRSLDFAEKMIREERGNTKKFAEQATNLASDITAITQRLAGIAEEQAARTRAAADKARDAREKQRQAVLDAIGAPHGGTALAPGAFARFQAQFRAPLVAGTARVAASITQAAQFRALGLTATGDALAPTRKALQAGLRKIEQGISGTLLDTDKNRNLIARIRRVLSGEFGALTRDVRLKIKDLEDALTGKDKGGPLTPFRGLDVSRITRGLTREQAKLIQGRLASANLVVGQGGNLPLVGGRSTIVVPVKVDIDGREVHSSVRRHEEKSKRRIPTQTRGRALP